MIQELKTLRSLCMVRPNERLWEYQFKILDSLGFRGSKRGVMCEKEVLLREYLRRKYLMSSNDAEVIVTFLLGRVRVKKLKQALGRD